MSIELKQQEKYKNMLKRKNKEKKIYKDKNSSLRIEKINLIKCIERKDKEIERLNNIINTLFEYLKENSKQPELFESDRYYEDILDKLQELLDKGE